MLYRVTKRQEDRIRAKWAKEKEIRLNAEETAKDAAHALFTFGAARRKVLLNPGEGIIDFLVQTLVNGIKADMMDPIPDIIRIGKKIYKLKVSSAEAAKIRKKYLQYHESWLEKEIENEFVGYYIFI